MKNYLPCSKKITKSKELLEEHGPVEDEQTTKGQTQEVGFKTVEYISLKEE